MRSGRRDRHPPPARTERKPIIVSRRATRRKHLQDAKRASTPATRPWRFVARTPGLRSWAAGLNPQHTSRTATRTRSSRPSSAGPPLSFCRRHLLTTSGGSLALDIVDKVGEGEQVRQERRTWTAPSSKMRAVLLLSGLRRVAGQKVRAQAAAAVERGWKVGVKYEKLRGSPVTSPRSSQRGRVRRGCRTARRIRTRKPTSRLLAGPTAARSSQRPLGQTHWPGAACCLAAPLDASSSAILKALPPERLRPARRVPAEKFEPHNISSSTPTARSPSRPTLVVSSADVEKASPPTL